MENRKEMKIPISAIVVGFNEENFIEKCLLSISFCEEIIFVDLGSSDSTVDIAKKTATKVYSHERVPTVEIIHHEFVEKLKHDWFIILDPDEVISDSLQNQIKDIVNTGIPDNIGGYYLPWIFYFKNKKLNGTPWGGTPSKDILLNRKKCEFLPIVHRGRNIIAPYEYKHIPFNKDNCIRHYWMNSYSQLFEKHWRYIKIEPKSRYTRGVSTNLKKTFFTPFKAFKYAFVETKGYKDRVTGLFLSIFWAWYETSCNIGLYIYQKKKR